MELTTVWFVAIAFAWTGYFVLEGFDFGVGMLLGPVGRGRAGRRTALGTIGPVWDGNEVWLIVAAGATFAAFPEWYATLFSGFYLPLLAILVALIVRGVALEYRGKRDDPVWQRRCDLAIGSGSLLPAVVWGVVLANLVRGVPLGEGHEFTGGLADVLGPFALLGGLTTVALFGFHGAVFLALRTDGPVRSRANRIARLAGPPVALLTAVYLGWLHTSYGDAASALVGAGAAASLVAAVVLSAHGREGWAFAGTALAVALLTCSAFVAMFPAVLPSTLDPVWTLTTGNAAATAYTLRIMTILGAVIMPFVLVYQGWTYWVFRRRVTG